MLCEEKNVEELINAIKSILEQKELAEQLKKGGYEVVARYDYQEIAPKYKRILRNV